MLHIFTKGYGAPYGKDVRIPPYEKKNKASSGVEDDAKSAEVGTCEVGQWSDLSGGRSSARAGKF